MSEPMKEFWTKRRVEFADTDIAGIVHFARLFVFMESAEHQFLNALGTSVHTDHEGQRIGWPRVRARAEFLSPVRFEDEVDIRVRVTRRGKSSLTYGIDIFCKDRPVAKGELVTVCCALAKDGPARPVAIPQWLSEKIVVVSDD